MNATTTEQTAQVLATELAKFNVKYLDADGSVQIARTLSGVPASARGIQDPLPPAYRRNADRRARNAAIRELCGTSAAAARRDGSV